jgi:hypothetical protein
MSLRRLLPTLDNAGRRLVLAEVLGQPVSMRHARRRGRPNPAQSPQDAKPSLISEVKLDGKSDDSSDRVTGRSSSAELDTRVAPVTPMIPELWLQETQEGDDDE